MNRKNLSEVVVPANVQVNACREGQTVQRCEHVARAKRSTFPVPPNCCSAWANWRIETKIGEQKVTVVREYYCHTHATARMRTL